jgi:hypothetical protein
MIEFLIHLSSPHLFDVDQPPLLSFPKTSDYLPHTESILKLQKRLDHEHLSHRDWLLDFRPLLPSFSSYQGEAFRPSPTMGQDARTA